MNGREDSSEVPGLPTTVRNPLFLRGDSAAILAKTLSNQAIDVVFIMDGFDDSITRAAFAEAGIQLVSLPTASLILKVADGYSRITGRLVCAIICHELEVFAAFPAMASALLAESPILILAESAILGKDTDSAIRGPRQTKAISALTKFSGVVANVEALAGIINRASLEVLKNVPGLAYLAFEEGLFSQETNDVPSFLSNNSERLLPQSYNESAAQIVATRVIAAKRPCILFGHGLWNADARRIAREFCHKLNVPGYVSQFAGGIFAPGDRYSVSRGLAHALSNADLVIVVGDLGSFSLPEAFDIQTASQLVRISQGRIVNDLSDNFMLPPFDESGVLRAALELLGYAEDDGGSEREQWLYELRDLEQKGWSALTSAFNNHARSIHIDGLVSEIARFANPTTSIIYDPCLGFSPVNVSALAWRLDVRVSPVPGMSVALVLASDLVRPGAEILCITNASSFRDSGFDLEFCIRRSIPAIFVIYDPPVGPSDARSDVKSVTLESNPEEFSARSHLVEFARNLGAFGERVDDWTTIQAALQRARSHANCAVLHVCEP